MTELKPTDVIPGIIAAAVAAAGPMGTNEGAWKMKVNRAIPHIAAMINDGSRQWKTALEVLDASVFTGSYVRHEIEESSTRVILYVDVGRPSDNYPDGIENISTHRTDNRAGKDQLERIEKLQPGDELAMWRTMEPIKGTNKSRRTLVHFETRPKRTQSSAVSAPPVEQQRPNHPPAAAAPTSNGLTDATDSKRLNTWRAGARDALTNFEYDVFVERMAAKGIDPGGCSEVEWDMDARPVLRAIVAERNT